MLKLSHHRKELSFPILNPTVEVTFFRGFEFFIVDKVPTFV